MSFFRSIAVRQAALTAAVVLAAVLAFAVAALITVARAMEADTLHTIDTDLAGLVDVAVQGGATGLKKRIDDRLDVVSKSDAQAHYLLLDAQGYYLTGNLRPPVAVDPARSAAARVVSDGEPLLVRATRLRGGLTLYVGRSLAPAARVNAALRIRLAWAGAAALLGALAFGLLTARRLAERVARINAVFRRFQGGDSDARVNARDGDEFGRLAGHVHAHLAQIAQLLAVQREISANIAHELRTPLAHLDTRLRHVLALAPDVGMQTELYAARDDIRSIVSLFDALLDIALGEALDPTQRGVVDLSEVAADLADLYAASAEERGLDFAARIAPNVTMRGERMQLTRLIANLLDNACKFVPAGERVRLVVAAGPVITVEDSGPGVPAADRELIFRRFGRAQSRAPGHGLGLALVRVIATRHGLATRVEDAGPGARFVVAPPQARLR
ncbi:sensor histidine kinase [Sphingomonas sp.]|uniref:sensor histidine kinase n=1 Tax=Sphingomonas sp. TaxID=28214 RepID=UPI003CC55E29